MWRFRCWRSGGELFEIPAGADDPFVNTANVTCSPAGFPNVYEGKASWTTNLFQPAVEVVKSGPSQTYVGETVTYNFSITNLGSADSPNLVLASVIDTVLGDLTAIAGVAGCGTLASGASCAFTADYTIPAGAPSPLVNVVSVLYHPDGFPNDVADSDGHQLLVLTLEGCTPGFWQGGAGAALWNEPGDPDWIYGGTNPYDHNTLFNSFFSGVTDARLNGHTMYQLVGSDGGSDWAVKAARDMVAAYLNESALGGTYPASSLADLVQMWYDAVAGGDAGLEAFHNLVGGWNAGSCPLP